MFKKAGRILLVILLLVQIASAQSLRIYNTSDNSDITGASIVIQSQPNGGFQGFETLDLGVKVVNVAGDTLEIGAKKIEEDTLQPDVQHTFCFANGCYTAATFVSPSHIYLAPGGSDDDFLAHYLFDNRVHVRGISHVSYVFYDVRHPVDSAVVHVTFNTNVAVGVQSVMGGDQLQAYPNPAGNRVFFRNAGAMTGASLLITGMNGQTSVLRPVDGQLIFNTAQLPVGVYYYKLLSGIILQASGRVVIVH